MYFHSNEKHSVFLGFGLNCLTSIQINLPLINSDEELKRSFFLYFFIHHIYKYRYTFFFKLNDVYMTNYDNLTSFIILNHIQLQMKDDVMIYGQFSIYPHIIHVKFMINYSYQYSGSELLVILISNFNPDGMEYRVNKHIIEKQV